MIKMDKLSDDRTEQYKKIGSAAIFLVVFVVQIVNVFVDVGYLENIFPNLEKWIVQLIYAIINLVLYSVLYVWIFDFCARVDNWLWIKRNPKMYIRGKWLHIHDKPKLRIGVVDIKQEYDHFEARGQNFSYLGAPERDNHVTIWTYKIAVVKDDKSNCDYLGCYSADKRMDETQDGMHMLTVGEIDQKTGYPTYLRGGFADTFKVKNKEDKTPPVISNHCGDLYLYKMSKKLEDYLYHIDSGEILEKRVVELCNHPDFQDEPFVQKYRECMEKYNLWACKKKDKNCRVQQEPQYYGQNKVWKKL